MRNKRYHSLVSRTELGWALARAMVAPYLEDYEAYPKVIGGWKACSRWRPSKADLRILKSNAEEEVEPGIDSSASDGTSSGRLSIGEQTQRTVEIIECNTTHLEAWRLWMDTSDPTEAAKALEAMEMMEKSISSIATHHVSVVVDHSGY
ncbi:unnamed protein product [Linum trigynum]|uniref:Uncharacterized protein n=1 Tax=Linum trigynum TaxID=586398 RepID=A0AAV2E3Y7_9ROSI